ncbi:MAG: hypothetical protein FWG31_02210 [Oscillospiraceae bacterium]|nr:hypothetical protein [Oscillospiraceae bacterium]
MNKINLSEDTVIKVGKSIPLAKFHAYFEEATGKTLPGCEFQPWLNMQSGKTLKEAIAVYCMESERKPMKDLLIEERFHIISNPDKAFITAFDEKIKALGYDFGGGIGDGYCWGKYMIVYAKTGVKSKKVAARIYIRENGIVLRLFLNNINKHRTYIENTPEHIKGVFAGNHGNCGCNPKKENCRMRKAYTVDGRQIEKCSGVVFEFWNPTEEKLLDYMDVLTKFYPVK